MSDQPGFWGQVASWVWEHRDAILKRLRGIAAWFKGKPGAPGILILGPGGAGKTTLGKILAGEYDWLWDAPGAYEESVAIERYALTDAPEIEVVVPPGQEHRREASWADLHADLSAGKFRGVILLAAYGYHTLGQIRYRDHRLYEGNKGRFLQRYLADRRDQELTVLRQLAPHLKANRKKLWLLSLVAKQDLWWRESERVQRHYRDGDYGGELAGILARSGQRNFRYEFVFACLVISNFTTSLGENLQKNSQGYDHAMHAQSLRRLFEVVDALKNWETGQ